MLHTIWATIGIIVGLLILIPLLIIVVAIFFGILIEVFKLPSAIANVIAAWIDEKIQKK
jgi:hypothetical protein